MPDGAECGQARGVREAVHGQYGADQDLGGAGEEEGAVFDGGSVDKVLPDQCADQGVD